LPALFGRRYGAVKCKRTTTHTTHMKTIRVLVAILALNGVACFAAGHVSFTTSASRVGMFE